MFTYVIRNKLGLILSIFVHIMILLVPFSMLVSPKISKEIELFVITDEKPIIQEQKVLKKQKTTEIIKPPEEIIQKKEIIEPVIPSETVEAIPIAPPVIQKKAPVEAKAEPRDVEFGSSEGPRFSHREMPVYPLLARRLGKEGKVILRLTIDDKGKLLNLEIIEGSGYGFTESAIEAVRRSTFQPAMKEGKPILSRALLPIKFTLRRTE